MNKIYLLLISCFMLITGCTSENPVNSSERIQKSWIALPEADGLSVETSLFASSKINGIQGGELILQGSYFAVTNNIVTFDSKLMVPANAYSGTRILTQEIGNGTFADFGPSMIFSTPLILDWTITGLDLTGVDPNQINFYYMAPDGSLELTQNDGLYINIATGTLKVSRARINHFSRYGWAK